MALLIRYIDKVRIVLLYIGVPLTELQQKIVVSIPDPNGAVRGSVAQNQGRYHVRMYALITNRGELDRQVKTDAINELLIRKYMRERAKDEPTSTRTQAERKHEESKRT